MKKRVISASARVNTALDPGGTCPIEHPHSYLFVELVGNFHASSGWDDIVTIRSGIDVAQQGFIAPGAPQVVVDYPQLRGLSHSKKSSCILFGLVPQSFQGRKWPNLDKSGRSAQNGASGASPGLFLCPRGRQGQAETTRRCAAVLGRDRR